MNMVVITAVFLALYGVTVCSGFMQRSIVVPLKPADDIRLYSEKQNFARPQNEFSRVYHTESILTANNREYRVEVAASAEELQALCKRFSLPEISSLSASLSIRKHSSGASRKGTTGGRGKLCVCRLAILKRVLTLAMAFIGLAVEVQGNLQSQLKQICVRTGQPFDVDLEFPLQVVVRPLHAGSALSYDESSEDTEEEDGSRKQRYPQKQQQQPRSLDDISMMELTRMLQDIDLSEDVFEDDAIYDAVSKQLDVGELVAQFLFVNLDPYPKKPGTDPIRISISG